MKLIFNSLTIVIVLFSFQFSSCTSIPLKNIEDSQIIELNKSEIVVVNGVINFTLPEYKFLWDTAPVNGKLLFSSFVPRMAYRDEELSKAITECARQVSILYNSKVDAKFAVKSNNRDLGYLEEINIQYDKALAKDFESKIIVRSHYMDNEGTYVLAEIDGIKFKGNFVDNPTSEGEPDWLYNVPVVPGYLVSIGSVQRSRYKIDSIRLADEQAMANLAKQVSVVVKAKRADRDSEISGSAFKETNYEVTSTFMRGFYVLGRWSTDNGNTYHSLAVCPANQ